MESIKLNQQNLPLIKEPVSVPRYNRKDLSPSIVHIGLGNFHRSHQAAYLDELLERGIDRMGIFETNLIPDPFPLGEILKNQDYLYTLVTRSAGGEEKLRLPGSILGYLNASADRRAVLERLADNGTSLISLTVTEKGYYYDKKTEEPNCAEEAIKWDMAHPDEPKTAAGFLAAALALRYKAGRKPLTIMSCDNIPSNGKILKNCVLFFCREHCPEIIPWVNDELSFPCSMVDRITPVTTTALKSELEERYGVSDLWPVCGEDFRQWVLEDDFRGASPHYGEAGVQLVKDAEPYELMKMRLLNGSHSAMSYPSYLLGCTTVDEGISHPLIKTFIRDYYMEEVTPTLSPVPGINLTAYKDTLISRFSNKNIADTIRRLAADGASKIPNFILKPLSEKIRRKEPCDAMIFALASWARFLEGTDEQGKPIPIEDIRGTELKEAARKAAGGTAGGASSFLVTAGIQGLSSAQLTEAAEKLKNHLDTIHGRGIKKALEGFLEFSKP